MKGWVPIIAGLILIGVLTWVAFFWNRSEQSPESQIKALENSPVVNMEQVSKFELINQKGKVKFEKDEQDLWWITEPKKEIPDPLFFGGLADVLSEITRQRFIGKVERKELPQYGLDPPLATLIFQFRDHSKKKLRVGNVNPTWSALYAWYEDEPEVFLIQPKLRMFIVMGFNELRYRRLVLLNTKDAREFRIRVLDPALREELGVPESRTLLKQTTPSGSVWFLMDPNGNKEDPGYTEQILFWMERGSISDRVFDITPRERKQWGLDPPSAYFEIVFPSQTEKILIGKEKEDWIYLLQENRSTVLGYQKEKILEFLSYDFQAHRLITENDLMKLNQIEITWQNQKKAKLVKLDNNFWAIDGEPKHKFQAYKTVWLTENLQMLEYQKPIRERPLEFSKYGLDPPRLKLKFYSDQELLLEVWIGKWETKNARCYVYVPSQNLLSWYSTDLMEGIPPDAHAFLAGEKRD